MPRLISREGRAEDVPDANVEAALRAGYTPETGLDVTQASERRIVDDRQATRGPADQLGAAALGFASGATFGASNVIADSLGIASREQQANLRADFATTSALSEVAGAIAPSLLTGGAGGAGAVARLTPAGRASMIAARIAEGGEGAGALRGVLRAAGAGAFEGAAQTAGSYLSDAALHDKDLSAEAFIAEAGKGALLGGATAGGLAAAERGFVAARSMFPRSTGSKAAVRKAAEDVDAALSQALTSGDESVRRATAQLDTMAAADPDLAAAAQARVNEARALKAEADAAAAQGRADLVALRVERAKNPPPKSSRPRAKGKAEPTAPADAPYVNRGGTFDELLAIPAGKVFPGSRFDEADLGAVAPQTVVGKTPPGRGQVIPFPGSKISEVAPAPVAPAKSETWREFVAARMGAAMKSEGSHGAAMKKLGAEWKARGAAPPAAEDDLMAALAGTAKRMEGGESFAALNAEGRGAAVSKITPMHEAMAEIDPAAKAIVDSVKAQEQAADAIKRRFTIRDADGTHRVSVGELPPMTVGRIKQAYLDATPAERAAILDAIGADKAKALTEIVEGRAQFDKWYKNKNHWYEDGSYNPAEAFPVTRTDLEMRMPAGAPPVREAPPFEVPEEVAGHLDTISANKAAAELTDFERAHAALVDALGPNAPPEAMALSKGVATALAEQERKAVARMAQAADSGEAARAAELVSLPGAGDLPAPAKRGGLLGMASDFVAANEGLQALGIQTPFDVDNIPVIGPLLGAWGKFRAASGVARKFGLRLPFTGEARVAGAGAKARDAMAESVDRLLASGAKAARQVRPVAPSLAWRAADVIADRLYDDGSKRKTATMAEAMRARSEELRAAQANPAGVRAAISAAMSDVRDPDLIDAAVAVGMRKVDYLAKHAPQPPLPDVLGRSPWRPSATEVERFARRVRAANDPSSVLADVASGRITAEAAETLREVYPRLYQETQERLVERSAELQADLPHALVVRLSVLFDAPLVRSLEPGHMAAIQAAGHTPAQPPAPAGPGAMQPPPAGAPDVSQLFQTADQRRMR